jgi:hypothetical protein
MRFEDDVKYLEHIKIGDTPLGLSSGIKVKNLMIDDFVMKSKPKAHFTTPIKKNSVRATKWNLEKLTSKSSK